MQKDMHYYGTYAMARAAGLKRNVAETIATAAQFVDDNAHKGTIEFVGGGSIDKEATAHGAYDINNTVFEKTDQRQVWVPFHFLPGNKGDAFTERLMCQKNSSVAQGMLRHHFRYSASSFFVELLGVTAHVYADTFSHYGFSGVSSRRNRIVNDSFRFYEMDKQSTKKLHQEGRKLKETLASSGFLDNIQSFFAEEFSGALGHGAAVHYPDLPYLIWDFEYEQSGIKSEVRNNQETFHEACCELYKMFEKAGELQKKLSEEGSRRELHEISDTIKSILALHGEEEERANAWRNAALDGKLFSAKEEIPEYNDWNNDFDALDKESEAELVLDTHIFRFFQAAAMHRTYVLRDLLPSYGLVVA